MNTVDQKYLIYSASPQCNIALCDRQKWLKIYIDLSETFQGPCLYLYVLTISPLGALINDSSFIFCSFSFLNLPVDKYVSIEKQRLHGVGRSLPGARLKDLTFTVQQIFHLGYVAPVSGLSCLLFETE